MAGPLTVLLAHRTFHLPSSDQPERARCGADSHSPPLLTTEETLQVLGYEGCERCLGS